MHVRICDQGNLFIREQEVFQFVPYSIKSGLNSEGRWFSFNYRDSADVPFDGPKEVFKLRCGLHYAVEK